MVDYLDRRILRHLAFLELERRKKRKKMKRERERHGLIGVALRKEGTLNLAARIAFRSGYENFPPRSPAFLYAVIVFIFNREGHRAASNAGTRRSTFGNESGTFSGKKAAATIA